MTARLVIYDTSLRDGTQSSLVNLSRGKKLAFLKMLDLVGVDYAELGWPGSNEEDMRVFLDAAKMHLRHTRISAFGSTRRMNIRVEEDANVLAILESGAPTCAIVGKSDLDHVKYQLRTTPEENLRAIEETIEFLKARGLEVFYDAEHFFDGFRKSRAYAVETLAAAREADADCLVLCDTNGGALPWEIEETLAETMAAPVLSAGAFQWGIHTHNDSELGVANALTAVRNGVLHIQGTVNGYGERSGNSSLCSILPNLILKMGGRTQFDLSRLTELSAYFDALAQVRPNPSLPFVGEAAFTHKGGLHVDAMAKFEQRGGGRAYEHIPPQTVGNRRRYVMSELSGKANVLEAGRRFGFEMEPNDPRIQGVLKEVEALRKGGYHIGGLEAETFLLLDRHFGSGRRYFEITEWNVQTEKTAGMFRKSNALLTIRAKGRELEASYTGISSPLLTGRQARPDIGPIRAIYRALLNKLRQSFPHVFADEDTVRAVDYEVALVEGDYFRVKIESAYRIPVGERRGRTKYREERWETLGVSSNIIEASVEAAGKAFNYILRKTGKSLGELLDENSRIEDVSYLLGEDFHIHADDIALLYRLDSGYRRKHKSRRKGIVTEIFLAFLDTRIKAKASGDVGEAIMDCLRAYTRDPLFADRNSEPSAELGRMFNAKLDPVYAATKIGRYNRQFEYAARVMASLIRQLREEIARMGLDREEIARMHRSLVVPAESLAAMFKRYWKLRGEDFYDRILHWSTRGAPESPDE